MHRRRLVVVSVMALSLAGCGGLTPVPDDIYVPLPMAPAAALSARDGFRPAVWRVAPLTAAGVYLERPMLYSKDGGATLRQHPYQFWIDAPANLTRNALGEYLREAGVAERVVTTADSAARFEVRGRIAAFDRLLADDQSSAHLALVLELIDTESRQVKLSRHYEERQVAAENTAAGVAAAAAQGLAAIFRRFVADTQSIAQM